MSTLQELRCKVRLHRWGPVIGDDWGGHQVCGFCGRSRRLGVDRPADAHDGMGLRP